MPGHENVFHNAEETAKSKTRRTKMIDPKVRYKFKLFKRKRKEATPARVAELRQMHEEEYTLLSQAAKYHDPGASDTDKAQAVASYDLYQQRRAKHAEGHDSGVDINNPKKMLKSPKGLLSWLFNIGPQGGRAGHKESFDSSVGQEYYQDEELHDTNFENFNAFGSLDGDTDAAAGDTATQQDEKKLKRAMKSQIDDMAFRIDVTDVDRRARNFGTGKYTHDNGDVSYDFTELNPENSTDTIFSGKTGATKAFNMDPEYAMGETLYNKQSLINTERASAPAGTLYTPDKLSHYVDVVTILPTESYRNIAHSKHLTMPWNKITKKKDESTADFTARKKRIFGEMFIEQIKSGKTYKKLLAKRKRQKPFDEETDPVLLSYIADQKMTSYGNNGEYSTAGTAGHAYFRMRQRYKDKLVGQYSFGVVGGIGSETMASKALVSNPDDTTLQGTSGDVIALGEKEVSAQQELSAVGFVRSVIASGRSFNLMGYNCTAFAVEAAKAAGVTYNSTHKGVGLAGSKTKMDTPFDLVQNEGRYADRAALIESEISDDADTIIRRYSDKGTRRSTSLYISLYELVVGYAQNSDPNHPINNEKIDEIIDVMYSNIAQAISLKYAGEPIINTKLRNCLRSFNAYRAEMGSRDAYSDLLELTCKGLKDSNETAKLALDCAFRQKAHTADSNAKLEYATTIDKNITQLDEISGELDGNSASQTGWSDSEHMIFIKLKFLLTGLGDKVDSSKAAVVENLTNLIALFCSGMDTSALQSKMSAEPDYIVAILRDIAKAIALSGSTEIIDALKGGTVQAQLKAALASAVAKNPDSASLVGTAITQLFSINNRFGVLYTNDAERYGGFYNKLFTGLGLDRSKSAKQKEKAIQEFLELLFIPDTVKVLMRLDDGPLLVLMAKSLSATAELRGFSSNDLNCENYNTFFSELNRLHSIMTFRQQIINSFTTLGNAFIAGSHDTLKHPDGFVAPLTKGEAVSAAENAERERAIKARKKKLSQFQQAEALYTAADKFDLSSDEIVAKSSLAELQNIYTNLKKTTMPAFLLQPSSAVADEAKLRQICDESSRLFGVVLTAGDKSSANILNTTNNIYHSVLYSYFLFVISCSVIESGVSIDEINTMEQIVRLTGSYAKTPEFINCVKASYIAISKDSYNPEEDILGGATDTAKTVKEEIEDGTATAPGRGADPTLITQYTDAAKALGFVGEDFIPAFNSEQLITLSNELSISMASAFGFDSDGNISEDTAIEKIVNAARTFALGDQDLASCSDFPALAKRIYETVANAYILFVFSVSADYDTGLKFGKMCSSRIELIKQHTDHHKLTDTFNQVVFNELKS